MTVDVIKKEVIELISELFKDKGFDNNIIDYVDLINNLEMDSITFITMIVEIETRFGIIIQDDLLFMENFKNINCIVQIIIDSLMSKFQEMEETHDAEGGANS